MALLPSIAPTPIFPQFSEADEFVSRARAEALAEAAVNPKVATYSNVGHDLQDDATVTADRESWLAEQLGLAK